MDEVDVGAEATTATGDHADLDATGSQPSRLMPDDRLDAPDDWRRREVK
jgi:hypothetical protein